MQDKEIFIPELLYGITGQPLDHSLSPLIHNWGFQWLHLKAVYYRWPVDSRRLAGLVQAARTLPISGVSVTIPHKQAIIPLLDGLSRRAAQAGAVNTVYWQGDQLWGDNTDIQGFLRPWTTERWQALDSVLVLGNGGAARAVLVGLSSLGVGNVSLCGRDAQRTLTLAEEFRAMHLPWDQRGQWRGELLVNATPLGMAGQFAGMSPWPAPSMQGITHVYDLVYNPLQTPLVRAAMEHGATVISGLEMLLGQACAQFALWTGHDLPLDQLRELVVERLSRS